MSHDIKRVWHVLGIVIWHVSQVEISFYRTKLNKNFISKNYRWIYLKSSKGPWRSWFIKTVSPFRLITTIDYRKYFRVIFEQWLITISYFYIIYTDYFLSNLTNVSKIFTSENKGFIHNIDFNSVWYLVVIRILLNDIYCYNFLIVTSTLT